MDTKKAIELHKDYLAQLSALKEHIRANFPGSTVEERYEVLDVIARVCDREENLLKDLKFKLLFDET